MVQPSTGILGIIKFASAILGISLFMWTPRTGKNLLMYGVLLVLLILLLVFISRRDKKSWR